MKTVIKVFTLVSAITYSIVCLIMAFFVGKALVTGVALATHIPFVLFIFLPLLTFFRFSGLKNIDSNEQIKETGVLAKLFSLAPLLLILVMFISSAGTGTTTLTNGVFGVGGSWEVILFVVVALSVFFDFVGGVLRVFCGVKGKDGILKAFAEIFIMQSILSVIVSGIVGISSCLNVLNKNIGTFAILGWIVGLAVVIAIAVLCVKLLKRIEDVDNLGEISIAIKIITLIFVNLVAGIILLCANRKDLGLNTQIN